MELKELIISLSSLMSVTGNESYSADKLKSLIGDVFDECYTDKIGNHIFVKRCGRENAPKIMIDCHFDEIGMIVSDICEGGFLKIANIGGVDAKILQSAEVTVYGSREIYGVISSTPPHLSKPGSADKAKEIGALMIDTGLSKEELEEICTIGTPIGFKPKYTELLGGRIAGKAFDDKACGACAVYALSKLSADELAGDVYFAFTTREEVGGFGAATSAYGIDPDYALVMDVTNSWVPGVEGRKWSIIGSGVAISVSAVTSRRLTKMTRAICDEKKIKYTLHAEPGNTGTDANRTGITLGGIPTVLCSLPLRNMHTSNEVLSLDDAHALADLTREIVTSEEIAEVFKR
ncbi:MAG: M20/M25/M40 family metallo-hydrolase [Clostridia bacterium]|nr:M20/M25/M40 family metallo-hydrolase [Clostridia bacterium]